MNLFEDFENLEKIYDIRRDSIQDDADDEYENSEIPVQENITECVRNSQYISSHPYNLEWVFGHNPTIPIVNLTTQRKSTVILFASSHICGIYNVKKNNCEYLLEHENEIILLACDLSGRFLISADINCINFWDRECDENEGTTVIHTIDYKTSTLITGGLSPCGKLFVTIDKKNSLKFWLWSYGNDDCDGEITLSSNYGEVLSIKYDKTNSLGPLTFLVVTFKLIIIFIQFHSESKEIIVHKPKFYVGQQRITDTACIENTRRVISVTEKGRALIWSDILAEPSDKPITIYKEYIKNIHLQSTQINTVTSIDRVLATCDDIGNIRFYDKDIKFLYWLDSLKVDSILSISFNLTPRFYRVADNEEFSERSYDENVDVIRSSSLPLDATIEKNPFLVRDFVVVTKSGRIANINFLTQKSKYILYGSKSHVASFDIHPTKPWICVGNKSAELCIYNYETKRSIANNQLPLEKRKDGKFYSQSAEITSIAYSNSGNTLFCGLKNGSIWSLDPILLTTVEKKPLKFITHKIDIIKFSKGKSLYCAITDLDFYLTILYYENNRWNYFVKYRKHGKRISCIEWLDNNPDFPKLISIGEDRLCFEYDTLIIKTDNDEGVVSEKYVSQSVIPLAALIFSAELQPNMKTASPYFLLIGDSTYKFQFFTNEFDHLKTINGPNYDKPIQHMILYKKDDNDKYFIVFATNKTIGLQMMPIEGDPLERVGTVGSPHNIIKIALSYDKKYLITLSENDFAISMWSINTRTIVSNYSTRGPGMESFCTLLPGGKRGWLFKEMQDVFYYIQILCSGINYPEERVVSEQIPITEVADYMRGIGFFPSDYEINHMIAEIKRKLSDEEEKNDIYFEDLVKLYINYRPVNGVEIREISKAFKYFCNQKSGIDVITKSSENTIVSCLSDDLVITKDKLLKILKENGEAMTYKNAIQYLYELSCRDEEKIKPTPEEIYELLPHQFNFKSFITNILGIPLDVNIFPLYTQVCNQSSSDNMSDN